MRALLSRVRFRDNRADRLLIKPFEAAFVLQVFPMTADRTFATKCFCRMGIRALKWGTGR